MYHLYSKQAFRPWGLLARSMAFVTFCFALTMSHRRNGELTLIHRHIQPRRSWSIRHTCFDFHSLSKHWHCKDHKTKKVHGFCARLECWQRDTLDKALAFDGHLCALFGHMCEYFFSQLHVGCLEKRVVLSTYDSACAHRCCLIARGAKVKKQAPLLDTL